MACAAALTFIAARPAGALRPVCPNSPHAWTHGPWTIVEKPGGLGDLRGAAVDVDRPGTIYATDGRRITRSRSGGCSWQLVLDLAARGASDQSAPGAEITSLVVAGGGRVYATVAKAIPLPGGAIEPVLVSLDEGRSWQAARGLPPLLPSRLRVSPADPDVMYLSLHTAPLPVATVMVNSARVGDVWSFYGSTDGGRSWSRRSIGQNRARFVPDPIRPSVVWALGSETSAFGGPFRSDDGGVTWTATPAQPANDSEQADLDVVRTRGGPAHLVIAQGDGTRTQGPLASVYVSSDDGRTFRDAPTDGLAGRVESVAFGGTAAEVVVSSHSGVYRLVRGADEWRDVDSLNLAPLTDATRIPRAQPSWSFWRPELIAVYRESTPLKPARHRRVIPPPPVACPANREFSPAESARRPRAALEAPREPVALEPSVPGTADFRLSLPAVPTRLDTYFLLDTSGSMAGAIDGVVCGLEQLVHGLARAGVDAQFGLGEFQDANGLRYRRVVDIGPPGFDLQSALRTRKLQGSEEPHRGALYQTATGAGLRDAAGRALIAPRQAATYRADALPVVLLVTDEPYTATTAYEPAVAQVIAALRARNIHHVGIHVRSADASPATAVADDALTRRQLEEFSRGTRTFAPAGGVDCDGDGTADLPPGAPLVCTVDREGIEANLADTLTAVLLAVRKEAVATLRPVDTAGMQVRVPDGRRLDVRDDHTGRSALVVPATITCGERQAGRRHTLVMAADVLGAEVARTPFDVTCGELLPATGLGGVPLAAAGPPAVAPVGVPATEPNLSGSTSGVFAANPASAPGLTVQGEMPGALALAPEEREPGLEPAAGDGLAGPLRMLGAGVLFAGSAVLELRRRSLRRALSTVRR